MQANSKITELEAKLADLQQELTVLQQRTKEHQLFGVTHTISQVLIQDTLLAD